MTLSITVLSANCHYAVCHYAECDYAECHYAECRIFYYYAECHYAECHYAECRGAVFNAASSLGSSLIFVAKAGAHKGGHLIPDLTHK